MGQTEKWSKLKNTINVRFLKSLPPISFNDILNYAIDSIAKQGIQRSEDFVAFS